MACFSREAKICRPIETVITLASLLNMQYWSPRAIIPSDALNFSAFQNPEEGMQAIRGELSVNRIISSAWDKEGWHGVRKGKSETSIPPPRNRRIHARLRKWVAHLGQARGMHKALVEKVAGWNYRYTSAPKQPVLEGDMALANRKLAKNDAHTVLGNSWNALQRKRLELLDIMRRHWLRHETLYRDVAGALREAEDEVRTCQAEQLAQQQELARLQSTRGEAEEVRSVLYSSRWTLSFK